MTASIGRWLRNLTSDDEVLEADSLSVETDATGAQRACYCHVGDKVEIFGKLRMVQLQPCDDVLAAVVAEVYDGTDAVDLVWLGRRSIAGIEAGRSIRASGRIAQRENHKAIYNPTYQLMPVGA